jgi:hypothetical protein
LQPAFLAAEINKSPSPFTEGLEEIEISDVAEAIL